MKKFIKISLAILLTLSLLAGTFVCFASAEKTYFEYDKYVLLGDSVASGHDDILYLPTEFIRVEGSYSDIVADTLGAELIPMACPGFRTVEIRYMLEDDYTDIDEYLFYGTDDPEVMKERIPMYRQNIAEADLITLGVGGNDFGTVLTWIVADIMEEKGINPKLVEKLRELGEHAGDLGETIDKVVDLANTMNALPALIEAVPPALAIGMNRFYVNWNKMIGDIYALNPDVTLLVVGMFDNAIKSEEDLIVDEADAAKLNIGQMVVDLANVPMKDGAKKYGYTFVDTAGTICVTYHPTAEGHQHIADRILEALPDASLPYTDVTPGNTVYNGVYYFYKNNILPGVSETEFGVNNAFTKAELAKSLYAFAGYPEVTTANPFTDTDDAACIWAAANGYVTGNGTQFGPDDSVSSINLALTLFKSATIVSPGIYGILVGIICAFSTLSEYGLKSNMTKGDAVAKLYEMAVIK